MVRHPFRFALGAWPIVSIITIGLCALTDFAAKIMGIELPDQQNMDIVLKSIGWNKRFWLQLVPMVVVAAPVLEELFFRKLLYSFAAKITLGIVAKFHLPQEAADLSDRKKKIVNLAMALISSALFSAAHYLKQAWPDNAFVALFFFGLAQCFVYHKTRSIWSPVLVHSLFNATNLALAALSVWLGWTL